jgi:hypothetical protein
MARARIEQQRLPPAKTPKLNGMPMRQEILDLLTDLQMRVRSAGHAKPGQGTLIASLLHSVAEKDGQELEREYLVPFRKAYTDED